MGTRVLQQQPLDHQHFTVADDPCTAIGTQLQNKLATIGLGPHPQRVTDASRKIDVNRRVSEATQAQLIEQAEAFEQQLHPMLREV